MPEGQELTYDQIVEHIVSDKPVPNVVEVPNITLDESLRSASEMAPRPKPWEKSVPDNDTRDDFQIDSGCSDLSLDSAITDLATSRYEAMDTELDSVITDPENSQT